MKPIQRIFGTSLMMSLFFGLSAYAEQGITAEQMKSLIGVYQGGDASWAGGSTEIKCQVSISVNKKGQVVATMKHKDGITLYSRDQAGGMAGYKATVLPEITHPLQKVSKFVKSTYQYENDYQNYVDGGSFKNSETWYLRISHLDKPYASVQMTYRKVARFQIYDATLAYIPDMNGCYNLRKIQ